jgi:hypothetical protein
LTAGVRETGTRDREAQAVVRYCEDTAEELARARAAVAVWRDRNPAGTGEELIATMGHQFRRDYGVVLRGAVRGRPAPGPSGHRHPRHGATAVTGGYAGMS